MQLHVAHLHLGHLPVLGQQAGRVHRVLDKVVRDLQQQLLYLLVELLGRVNLPDQLLQSWFGENLQRRNLKKKVQTEISNIPPVWPCRARWNRHRRPHPPPWVRPNRRPMPPHPRERPLPSWPVRLARAMPCCCSGQSQRSAGNQCYCLLRTWFLEG